MSGESKTRGLGVDSQGGPVVDPTENVIALTDAANKRQDDLRQLNNERINAELRVLQAKMQGLEAVTELRAIHAKEMRESESSRLDAIRQVDVTAVKTEAERATAAISVLASTTQANAENLRNALNTTASTIAAQNASTVSQLTDRIAALEKSSYEGAGKGQGVKNLSGIMIALAMLALGFIGMVIAVITTVVLLRT